MKNITEEQLEHLLSRKTVIERLIKFYSDLNDDWYTAKQFNGKYESDEFKMSFELHTYGLLEAKITPIWKRGRLVGQGWSFRKLK